MAQHVAPPLVIFASFSTKLVGVGQFPLITAMLADRVRPSVLGAIQSGAYSVNFFAAAPMGRFGDRFGRSSLMCILLLITAISEAIMAQFYNTTSALAIGLVGLNLADLIDDACKSAIADGAGSSYWTRVLFVVFGVTLFVGPRLANFVESRLGFAWLLWSGAVLVLAVAAGLYKCAPVVPTQGDADPVKKIDTGVSDAGNKTAAGAPGPKSNELPTMRTALAGMLGNRRVVLLLLVRAFHACSAWLAISTMGLFARDALHLEASDVGALFSWIGLFFTVGLILSPIITATLDLSCRVYLLLGMVVTAVGRIAFASNVTTYEECLFWYTFVIFGISMYYPSFADCLNDLSSPQTRGVYNGVASMTETLAKIAMPFAGGLLIENFGIFAPYKTSAALSCLAVVPAIAFYLTSQRSDTTLRKDKDE